MCQRILLLLKVKFRVERAQAIERIASSHSSMIEGKGNNRSVCLP